LFTQKSKSSSAKSSRERGSIVEKEALVCLAWHTSALNSKPGTFSTKA